MHALYLLLPYRKRKKLNNSQKHGQFIYTCISFRSMVCIRVQLSIITALYHIHISLSRLSVSLPPTICTTSFQASDSNHRSSAHTYTHIHTLRSIRSLRTGIRFFFLFFSMRFDCHWNFYPVVPTGHVDIFNRPANRWHLFVR